VALGQAHWTPIDGAAVEELIAARRAAHDCGTLVLAAAGPSHGRPEPHRYMPEPRRDRNTTEANR
jgi:hypothetical protein